MISLRNTNNGGKGFAPSSVLHRAIADVSSCHCWCYTPPLVLRLSPLLVSRHFGISSFEDYAARTNNHEVNARKVVGVRK